MEKWLVCGDSSIAFDYKKINETKEKALMEARKAAEKYPKINFYVGKAETEISSRSVIIEKTDQETTITIADTPKLEIVKSTEPSMSEILASIRRIIHEDDKQEEKK